MNFDLNTEQKMLKDSARNFFSREADTAFIRKMENDIRTDLGGIVTKLHVAQGDSVLEGALLVEVESAK